MNTLAFTQGLSCTHDLLFRTFVLSAGFLAPISPQEQYTGVREAYPLLKGLASKNLEKTVHVEVHGGEPVAVTGRDDGLAFAELYRGIELFVGPDTVLDGYAVNAVLSQWIRPLAGRKLLAQPALWAQVSGATWEHLSRMSPQEREQTLLVMEAEFRIPRERLLSRS